MRKPKLLSPLNCQMDGCKMPAPFQIFELSQSGNPLRLNDAGTEFWVLLNDKSRCSFSCCKSCFASLNIDNVQHMLQDQIYTWGMEIITKPSGFYEFSTAIVNHISKTVFLRAVAFTKEERGLSSAV